MYLEWGTDCVNSWYEGHWDYEFTKPYYSQETQSFTQLLWSSSTSVGFAMSVRPSGTLNRFYCVAHFSPAGNVNGSYPQNVKPYYASTAAPTFTVPTTTTTVKTSTVPLKALPTGCLPAYRNDILNRTNILRAAHNSRPVTEMSTLDANSLNTAQLLMSGQAVSFPTTVAELRFRRILNGSGIYTASDCACKLVLTIKIKFYI